MRYSDLHIDGRPISRLGFGAMGFAGWFGAQDESQWHKALYNALDAGVTFVDTARAYGGSEGVVGRALRAWSSESPIVATKVEGLGSARRWGIPVPVEQTFPKGQVQRSVERSLAELGVDSLDLVQMHVWWPTWGTDGYWADELRELRDKGLIKHIGVSIPDHRSDMALPAVASGLFESVQTIINIFDPLALDALVPACERANVVVIARCVLDEGGLTGTLTSETQFPEDDYRHGYFDDTVPREVYLEKVDALRQYLPEYAESLAALALKFVTQSEGVSCALASMHTPKYATANVAALEGPPLPPEIFDALRTKHRFIKNFNNASHWE